MKTLGLIGGTTWVSTIDYYKYINELTIERLGGLNSAQILLYSVCFEPVKAFADVGDWENFGKVFADSARNLENAGAEAIVLCANTAHIVAERVESAVSIPLIHITDATAREILSQNLQRSRFSARGSRWKMISITSGWRNSGLKRSRRMKQNAILFIGQFLKSSAKHF